MGFSYLEVTEPTLNNAPGLTVGALVEMVRGR